MDLNFTLVNVELFQCNHFQSGDRLLTGCNDKNIRIFNIENKVTEPEATIEAHNSAIKCAIWSGNPNHVATCAEDSELRYVPMLYIMLNKQL